MKDLFLSFMRKSIGVSSRIAGGVVSLKIPLEGFHLMQVNYIKRTMSPPQSKILNQPKGRWKRGRSPCASPSTEKKTLHFEVDANFHIQRDEIHSAQCRNKCFNICFFSLNIDYWNYYCRVNIFCVEEMGSIEHGVEIVGMDIKGITVHVKVNLRI